MKNLQYSNIKDITIILYRDGCHGFCPQYQLTIFGSGQIEFEGLRWVKGCGFHQGSISPDKVVEILDQAIEIDFFNMKDFYDAELRIAIDKQGNLVQFPVKSGKELSCITIKIGSFNKKVCFFDDHPLPLYDLRKFIEEVPSSLGWVQ